MKPLCALLALGLTASLFAQSNEEKRLKAAGDTLHEVMQMKDKAIPQDLLDKSYCAVIIPGLKKGAFIFGGKYGKGFFVCRHENGSGWGSPAGVRVEGGSVGFQIGGSEQDVILLVMNAKGAQRLLSSQFKLGGEASVAAGPVGRTSSAQTDAYLTAEILSYSRSRGVFAGISLEGSTLRQDLDVNKELYGKTMTNKEIISENPKPPAAAGVMIADLNKYSPRRSN
ncbi:lipid-binding SYLF domain-containing protein [Bryobacter aggregatus]|uniref:lipid-binding SYLF domain-containing protein n=1 Tax=Bryobacter aggregatus TaxID=360054 RepID=UPI00056B682B|nr:lipid-binding SYLF domain-containing protein [Bryobacter aggregatus]